MFYLIILYLIFYILGINLGYLSNSFDEYRLLEILLALCSCFFLVIKKIKFNKSTVFILFILFILFIFRINFFGIFFIQDIILWLSIFFICLALYQPNCLDNKKENIIAILILFSILPCFFIPLSIFNLLKENTWYDWQLNSGTIRIFDSYIVPIFWFSLYLYRKNNKIIHNFYYIICFLIGLALFFNGARSALISLVFPLLIIFFVLKEDKIIIIKTILMLILSFLVYFIVDYTRNFLYNSNAGLGISRFTTSKRYEIWEFMYQNWKNNPIWGVGGGFLAKEQYMYGHHSHNLFLRLIFEWGIIGVGIVFFLLYQIYILFKSKADPILKMGVLAILIDAMFSGNFIYPASQVICVFFIIVTCSNMKLTEHERSLVLSKTVKGSLVLSKTVILCYMGLFTYLVFNFLWMDITCMGCSSEVGRAAPFFWDHGSSEHLELNK